MRKFTKKSLFLIILIIGIAYVFEKKQYLNYKPETKELNKTDQNTTMPEDRAKKLYYLLN